ncbi:hypothetical protein ACOME3_010083 [Neoechinorhynchus agilis]
MTCDDDLNEAISCGSRKSNSVFIGNSSNALSVTNHSKNSMVHVLFNRLKILISQDVHNDDHNRNADKIRNIITEIDQYLADKKSRKPSISHREQIVLNNVKSFAILSLREILTKANAVSNELKEPTELKSDREIGELDNLLEDQIDRTYQRMEAAKRCRKFDDAAMLQASLDQLTIDREKLKTYSNRNS